MMILSDQEKELFIGAPFNTCEAFFNRSDILSVAFLAKQNQFSAFVSNDDGLMLRGEMDSADMAKMFRLL